MGFAPCSLAGLSVPSWYRSCLVSHMGETLWVCIVVEPSSNVYFYKTLPHSGMGNVVEEGAERLYELED